MMRLIAALITLNLYVVAALVIWTTDWRKGRADNDAELRERMALLRQRLAHPAEAVEEEWVCTNAPATGPGRRDIGAAVVGQHAAPGNLHASKRNGKS